MAIGKNTTDAMLKTHDQARKAYIAGDKKNNFQFMLNAEMYFWRESNCGLNEHMMLYHDMLIRQRKTAMSIRQRNNV